MFEVFCYIAVSLHRIQSNSSNLLVGNVVLALIYMHSSIVHYMSFIRKKFLVGRRSLEKYANYYDKVRGKGEEYISVKRVFREVPTCDR